MTKTARTDSGIDSPRMHSLERPLRFFPHVWKQRSSFFQCLEKMLGFFPGIGKIILRRMSIGWACGGLFAVLYLAVAVSALGQVLTTNISPTNLPAGHGAVLWQDFETAWTASNTPAGGWPTTRGWSKLIMSNNTDWVRATNGINGHPPRAREGAWSNPGTGTFSNFARYGAASYGNVTRLYTPPVDLTGFQGTPTMAFWHCQVPWPADQDYLYVLVHTNITPETWSNRGARAGAGGWQVLAYYTAGLTNWTQHSLAITNVLGTNMIFAFEGIGEYAYGTCVDDMIVFGNNTAAPVFGQVTNLWQDFETAWTASNTPAGGWPTTRGWTKLIMSNNTDWVRATNGINGHPPRAREGAWTNPVTGTFSNFARYGAASYGNVTRLYTPPLDLSGAQYMPTMTFWHCQVPWPADQDYLYVLAHTNITPEAWTNKGGRAGAGGWQVLAYYTAGVTNWTQRSLTITNVLGTNMVFAFEGIGEYAYGVCVDDLQIISMILDDTPESTNGGIALSPSSLAFAGVYGGASPAGQAFAVSNVGSTAFTWTGTVSAAWLSCVPPGGTVDTGSSTEVTASVDSSGMAAGVYTANLAIASANATNSPQTLSVTVTVSKAAQTITFPAIGWQHVTNAVGLAATGGGSGEPVTFAVTDGPGAIAEGTNLTFSGAGDVIVVASQAGNANYEAAAEATNIVSVYALSASAGAFAGGNTITISNGYFGTITNVLVGGVAATIKASGAKLVGGAAATIKASGANWVTITVPFIGTAGVKDIVIQTSDHGDTTLAAAYTVNAAGEIGSSVSVKRWSAVGKELVPGQTNAIGANNTIYGMNYYGNNLYISGAFTNAGGSNCARVARYDGTNWNSMGIGVPKAANVNCIKGGAYGVYAGGYFTNIGGIGGLAVGRWDGTNWNPMGRPPAAGDTNRMGLGFTPTINGYVNWMEPYKSNTVVAVGYFTNTDGRVGSVNYVAQYDGVGWTNMQGGFRNVPLTAAYDRDRDHLYVGGSFTNHYPTNESVHLNFIAQWNGTRWTNMARGLGNRATCMALHPAGGELYIGGWFTNYTDSAGNKQLANYVVKWDPVSQSLTNVGSGFNNWVYALAVDTNGTLYAAGAFTNTYLSTEPDKSAPKLATKRIAMWNGTHWTNMGCGLSDTALALTVNTNNSDLCAGGFFRIAYQDDGAGTDTWYVAKYGTEDVASSGVEPSSGSVTGGYEVVITGSNLGSGSDITNVTLCGVSGASMVSQSATQVVVVAGVSWAAGLGDVRVYSESYGETVKSNAFTYNGAFLGLRGTNGAEIASDEAASESKGTDFGLVLPGGAVTNTLAITNGGNETLTLTGWTTNGSEGFLVVSGPASVNAGDTADFVVAFAPSAGGTATVAVHIAHDGGGDNPFVLNLAGQSGKQDQTITFPPIGAQPTNAVAGLAATASSGLAVSFVTNGGPGVISDGTNLSFTGAGEVLVVASQAGDATWNPAPEVTNTLHVYALDMWTGPYAGGNTITITNGHFGTITNVLVGGVAASVQASGSDWVTIVVPATGSAGVKDVVIQTDGGDITLAGAYMVNPAGLIGRPGSLTGWVEVVGLPYGQAAFGAGVVSNKLYVAGGRNASSTVTNVTCFDGATWSEVAGLPQPRVDCRAAELNGNLYVVGGSYNSSARTNVYMYSGGVWSEVAGLPADRTAIALAYWRNALYVMGGEVGGTACTNVYRFDGVSWTETKGLPSTRSYNTAAVLDDQLYSIGGKQAGTTYTNVYRFDGTNWTETAGLPQSLCSMVTYTVGGFIYAISGWTGSNASSNTFRYDGETWMEVVSLPQARSSAGCGALGTNMYVVGGDTGSTVHTNVWKGLGGYSGGVLPTSGSSGDVVTIYGIHLGNGGDITNVTLCGVSAAIQSQSATQIVVTAGATAGAILGDVRVFSTSQGETVKSNGFTYTASGIGISGPAFAPAALGAVVTNIFTVTNFGNEALLITAATNDGEGAAYFNVSALVGLTVEPGTASNFPVVFTASNVGSFTPTCYVDNNSPLPSYAFGLTGAGFQAAPNIGPFAGGNTIAIINGVFGTITNVTVGGVSAPFLPQAANVVLITAPALGTTGTVDIVVQTEEHGDITFAGAYTYNPAGRIGSGQGVKVVDISSAPLTGWSIFLGDLMGDGYISNALAGDNVLVLNSDMMTQTLERWNWTQALLPQVVFTGTTVDNLDSGSDINGTLSWWNVDAMSFNMIEWTDGIYGYFGIRFQFDGQADYRYGWVEASRNDTDTFSVRRLAFVSVDGQTLQAGQTNLPGASGVLPESGSWTGGYEVVISGTNLCNGTDATNVTLCGMSAAIQSQSATQIVVIAGQAAAAGVGDVRVFSTSFGETVKSNAFEYLREHQASLVFNPASPQAYLTTNALTVSGGSGTGAASFEVLSGPGILVDDTNLAVTNSSGTIEIRATKAQDDLYFEASVTGAVVASKAVAEVYLLDLTQTYDGAAKSVTATTMPAGLTVEFTYDGSATAPTAAGSYAVTGTVNDANYEGSASDTLTINKAGQTITDFLPTNGSVFVVTDDVGLSAAASSGLLVSFATNGGPGVISDGTNLAFTGAGDVLVVASQAGDANWNPAAEVTNVYTVGKAAAQVYLLDLAQTYDGAAKSVTATTMPAGLTVEFTYDGHAWAPTNAGSYAVTGTVNDANYEGSASDTLTINKAGQTLADFLPTNGSVFVVTDDVGLSATASSGLAVSFATNGGPGVISDGTNLTFTGAGEVLVVASQPGDANWDPAADVTNTYTVGKAAAQVYLLDLAQTYDGTAKSVTATTMPAGLTVEFTYDGNAWAPTNVGSYAVTGTVNDINYQGSVADTLVVSKGVAGVFLQNLAQAYDGTAKSVTATSDPAGLVVEFTYDGNAWAPTNAGSYAVTGTINDVNYEGSAADTLVVSKADQIITDFLPTNGSVFVEDAAVGLSASASSGLPVSFAVGGDPGVINDGTNLTFTGPGEAIIVASQAGAANWNPAPDVTNHYTVLAIVTVDIESPYGITVPTTGRHAYVEGTVITNQAQSPDTRGTTQYVCAGWVATEGLAPDHGDGTQAVVTVINSATLTWLWRTEYRLESGAGPNGSVDRLGGWFTNNEPVSIEALPDPYFVFTNWTGDVAGPDEFTNPLNLVMDGAKSVTAWFTALWTTNRPTPHWWLAQFGITNDFEDAVNDDPDGDAIPTGDEFVMNTDPTNGLSFLHVARISEVYGTNCYDVVWTNSESPFEEVTQTFCDVIGHLLSWPAATGRVYDVEFDTDYPWQNWAPVEGLTNLTTETGWISMTNVLDATALKLYRLRVHLP